MTLRGSINRFCRRHGKGQPLFTVEDRLIRYSGIDKTDQTLFDHYMTVYFTNRFAFGKKSPDYRCMEIKLWLYKNCVAEFDLWFDPMCGEGLVFLSHCNDAFSFRMAFSDIEKLAYDTSFTMEASYHELARYGLA